MPGSRHGYEILKFLGSALEGTWKVSTSQLYVLLKKLEKRGLVESSLESQDSRPSRRVFALTRVGKKVFSEWLRVPVSYPRDFRIELLGKLFFYDYLSLSGAAELVEKQIQVLERQRKMVQEKEKREANNFKKLVLTFKTVTLESYLSWLVREVRPFFRKESNGSYKIKSVRKTAAGKMRS